MNSFEKMVRLYIKELGLRDKIALRDFVWLSIKDDLRKCRKEIK